MQSPSIECKQVLPTLRVGNIQASIDFFTNKLGFSLRFVWGEPVAYAGVGLGEVMMHLAQFPPGSIEKAEVNFVVSNANALYKMHLENGVPIRVPIGDREYGLRDYGTEDPDGNQIGFGHYIYNQGSPIKIERIDVPVRLEKRLAALLADLAAHKGMSISGTLEETLLHTFERIGDTIANPHTLSDLEYIQALKKKHGIDYDVHGSYRFRE
jgi:catechol 2,3-dioxygenase-like lactoylglutathione lyase family enzyme